MLSILLWKKLSSAMVKAARERGIEGRIGGGREVRCSCAESDVGVDEIPASSVSKAKVRYCTVIAALLLQGSSHVTRPSNFT